MDDVTQQNAASAEESASAAEEMSAQAEQMRGFVGELVAIVSGVNDGSVSMGGRTAADNMGRIKDNMHGTATPQGAKPVQDRTKSNLSPKAAPEKVIPLDDEDFQDF